MKRARRGSSALEFGLILPVLAALLFGVMDWAWYLFQQMTVVVAAGRGARIAGGLSGDDGPEAAAEAETRAWLDSFGLDGDAAEVSATINAGTDPQVITVSASLPYDAIVGMVPVPDQLAATSSGVYYGHLY